MPDAQTATGLTRDTVVRPNGMTYRPRKPALDQWEFADDSSGGIDYYAVVVGTHDIDKASQYATPQHCDHLINPVPVWVKRVMRDREPYIATDAVEHGAPGVRFLESDDPDGCVQPPSAHTRRWT